MGTLNTGSFNHKIEIKDSDVKKALKEGKAIFIPQALAGMTTSIIEDSIRIAKEYPPETAGNQPPPPYYSRGVGMIGRGGTLTQGKESEQLGLRWEYNVDVSPDEIRGKITNVASYSALVQDEDLQWPLHASNGWVTMQAILRSRIGDSADARGITIHVNKQEINEMEQRIADFFSE